jgi:Gpi18-like mannosyltransferase
LWIFLVFAASRAVLYLTVAATTPGSFPEQWSRWDAQQYVNIASFGYVTNELPAHQVAFQSRFPPLYPLLIWIVDQIPGVSAVAAGIALSLFFLFAASVLLYALVQTHTVSRRQALLAVTLMDFFPTSYFASAVYSEALFLFLTLLYFWCLIRYESYGGATAAAVGAVLTRSVGAVLLVVHFHAALYGWRRTHASVVKRATYFLLPLVALAAHLAAMRFLMRQPGYLTAEEPATAATKLSLPFAEPVRTVMELVQRPDAALSEHAWMTTRWGALFIFFAAAVLLWGMRRLPPLYRTYAASYLLFVSALTWNISAPRHVWVLFPVFMVLASVRSVAAIGGFLGAFTLGLIGFGRMFASGAWAF